jgi:hypothetical protein
MRQLAAKLSVSIPGEIAAALRKRVGARGAFRLRCTGGRARAVAHELESEGVSVLIAQLESEVGPPTKAAMARARRAWRCSRGHSDKPANFGSSGLKQARISRRSTRAA